MRNNSHCSIEDLLAVSSVLNITDILLRFENNVSFRHTDCLLVSASSRPDQSANESFMTANESNFTRAYQSGQPALFPWISRGQFLFLPADEISHMPR